MDLKDGSKMANMEHQIMKVSENCDQCKGRIETADKWKMVNINRKKGKTYSKNLW